MAANTPNTPDKYDEVLAKSENTRVVVVQPLWYQMLLVVLTLLCVVSLPLTTWIVLTKWPDETTIQQNREIFCAQAKVNGDVLSPQCQDVLGVSGK